MIYPQTAVSVTLDLIRHREGLGKTGFRLEFIPMKIGAGMTIPIEAAICKQTLNMGPDPGCRWFFRQFQKGLDF